MLIAIDFDDESSNFPAATLCETSLDVVQGTVKRIDHLRRELTIIAERQLRRFVLVADCQVWFEGKESVLSVFRASDPVKVIYECHDGQRFAQAVYGWRRRSDSAPEPPVVEYDDRPASACSRGPAR